MVWNKLGTTTLTSAGDTITVSDMTASKFNQFMSHNLQSGSIRPAMKINSATSGYANRYSENGASDATSTSRSNYLIDLTIGSYDDFIILYGFGLETEEKLFIEFYVDSNTSGAGNIPNRTEGVGKFANTTDTISSIEIFNTETGTSDFATDSNFSVLGSDGTESLNVQDGAIYYDTDLNKEYVLYNNTWTEI